jgi:tight adherence protein B
MRKRRSREIAMRRAGTIELCVAMADELRAGRLPADALLASMQAGGSLVPHAAEAVRCGRSVAPALLRDADHPGTEGLRLVAACWSVAEQQGGALATALDRVASALRAQELARRRVALELAAPRATARLLAALPVLGVVIGSASGANPLGVLIGTPWGWGLLAAGLILDLAGLAWVDRIARVAEQSG